MTTITNSTHLTGNLGADVEVRESDDTTYVHFSIATDYSVPAGDGRYEKRTSWVRVTAFGGQARSMAALGKGSLVQVLAHLRQSVVEVGDKKLVTHDVIADEVVFLRVKRPGGAAADPPPAEPEACESEAAAA